MLRTFRDDVHLPGILGFLDFSGSSRKDDLDIMMAVIGASRSSCATMLDLAINLWLTQRARRWLVNTQNSCRWKIEMVDALLDYDLVDFVLSIPREHTLWRRLVIKELRGLHQNLMKIPLHGYSHPVSSANLLILLKMMARRLPLIRRLVPGEPKPINGFANFLRNQSDSFKRTLLDGRAISRGLYNIGAIKRLLDEHSSGEQDHTRLLYRLISLELWFRFLEDAYHFNGFQVRSICRERPFTKEGLEMRT